MAKKDTILMIDDLIPWKSWGEGPTRAWTELLNLGVVLQDELLIDGKISKEIKPPGERAWARGRYASA